MFSMRLYMLLSKAQSTSNENLRAHIISQFYVSFSFCNAQKTSRLLLTSSNMALMYLLFLFQQLIYVTFLITWLCIEYFRWASQVIWVCCSSLGVTACTASYMVPPSWSLFHISICPPYLGTQSHWWQVWPDRQEDGQDLPQHAMMSLRPGHIIISESVVYTWGKSQSGCKCGQCRWSWILSCVWQAAN